LTGTLMGLWLSITLWQDRTPSSIRKALQWCRFNHDHSK
jgi:hypothetical protein